MIDHVSITVADMEAAERFYDAVMSALGIAKVGRSDRWIGYGERSDAENPERSYLSIRQADPAPPVVARHWCFRAPSRAAVDAAYAAGLAAGGHDDGPPGLRVAYHSDYYAAFLVDPAGNRIEAVCHRTAQLGSEGSS
jgi:catechol 2,3-dioxygenase-like lactoylglutathione lyase family enzyme